MQGISKTLKFILALLIVLGIAGYYVYYNFKPQPENLGGVMEVTTMDPEIYGAEYAETASILNTLQFDTAFFTDPSFASLVDFYKAPSEEAVGVPNPFIAF